MLSKIGTAGGVIIIVVLLLGLVRGCVSGYTTTVVAPPTTTPTEAEAKARIAQAQAKEAVAKAEIANATADEAEAKARIASVTLTPVPAPNPATSTSGGTGIFSFFDTIGKNIVAHKVPIDEVLKKEQENQVILYQIESLQKDIQTQEYFLRNAQIRTAGENYGGMLYKLGRSEINGISRKITVLKSQIADFKKQLK